MSERYAGRTYCVVIPAAFSPRESGEGIQRLLSHDTGHRLRWDNTIHVIPAGPAKACLRPGAGIQSADYKLGPGLRRGDTTNLTAHRRVL